MTDLYRKYRGSENSTQSRDTKFHFTDPRSGREIEVIAKEGESRDEAIARVKKHHGLT